MTDINVVDVADWSGLLATTAQLAIEAQGLSVATLTEYSFSVAAGLVISQQITATLYGSLVTLTVSLGEPPPNSFGKEPVAKTFQRPILGGRRYSRLNPDITPPTVPVLGVPNPNSDTQCTVPWTLGADLESGVRSTLLESRVNPGPGPWVQVAILVSAVPNNNYQFTDRVALEFYDYRVANVDVAGNVSAYSDIQTVQQPASAAQTAPGVISIVSGAQTVIEGDSFTISAQRTGQGSIASLVEADYEFTGASLPTPATGTLRWLGATGGIQTATFVSPAVSVDTTVTFRITEVRCPANIVQPTLGLATVNVTFDDQTVVPPGTRYAQDYTQVGLGAPTLPAPAWQTVTDARAANYQRIIVADPTGNYWRTYLSKQPGVDPENHAGSPDYRVQANFNGLNGITRQVQCLGFSVLIETPYVYPLHTFVFQSHHDENVKGTPDDLTQVPLRMEVEPSLSGTPTWRMSTIFCTDREGPHSGGSNTQTRVYGRNSGATNDLGDAFHIMVPGIYTRWAFRIHWDERPISAGGQGRLEIWKNGVNVADIAGPIGYGPHVRAQVSPVIHIGDVTQYNMSLGPYSVAQDAPADPAQRAIAYRFKKIRITNNSDIDYCRT